MTISRMNIFSIIIFKFAFLETVYFGEPEEKELNKI